ncbi:MAG: ATP-binding cassette subfamily B bacterial [Rhodospirillaceae bacterium]|nr:MAG: ATP-binding cassette subfamily B bacterial [Rhodospirillaceae bacterium]
MVRDPLPMRRHPSSALSLPRAGIRQDWRTIAHLLPHLWPAGQRDIKRRVVVSLVLLLAAKMANATIPLFFKQAVDALSMGHETIGMRALPVGLVLAYGLARMLSQGFDELRDALFAKVAERAVRALGLQTFRHLHALSLRFHLERQTGGLSRAVERGTHGVEVLLRLTLFRAGPSVLELLFVCGVLWMLYDWRFALATLVTIGGYVLFTFVVTEWRMQFRQTMNATDSEANTKAIDSLLNYETVKYFGNEEHEARRFDLALAAYERAAVRVKASLSFLNIGQGGIVAAGLVVIMLLAAHGITRGTMTVGDFVLVNTYLIQLYLPLNFLGMVYREIKQALTDMDVMFRLTGHTPEVIDPPDARALVVDGGMVTFESVSFAYHPDRTILKGVSFVVPAGRTTAIVGASGAGKSTLARLLFRFYDATSGRIVIDSQDIRTVTQASLRAAIGVVPQDTVLFNDTVFYNIAYGRPTASRVEIEHAARVAELHDFIMSLPEGYETRVGERGLKLSGGEKQRVAIARTLLKQPPILIFDEATSALDTHTEQKIQNSLRRVSANLTTLVIAHRLSTVIDADEILVLANGGVAERGTHAFLLAQNGLYAGLWHRQQKAARLHEALREKTDLRLIPLSVTLE